MTLPRRLALGLLLAVAGCEPAPATQVLVHFEAEPASRARTEAMRIQVFDTDGATKLDQTLRFGTGNPPVGFPVNLPLVPRGGNGDRTFAVVASLLDAAGPFSTQRLTGGYEPGKLVHIHVLFEDACADLAPCSGQRTCVDGACADACLSPTPSTCPRDDAPCGECTVRGDAGCVPRPEGTECTGGTCRLGACCTGCWDGTACQPGTEPAACGIAGSGCFSCACPAHACTAGACAIGRTATAIAAGGHDTCALGPAGELFCWGENVSGQLVTGDTEDREDPVEIPLVRFGQIAVGWNHICAIEESGTLSCWGENDEGEAGTGMATAEPVTMPAPIGEEVWKDLGLGDNHTCGVRGDGSLWCWGVNDRGQLGQGDIMDLAAPTRVGTGADWLSVGAGDGTTCALRDDGVVFCFGANYWGQVGRGDTTNAKSPARVTGTTTFTDVAVGGFHACAIATDHSLWCWGRNTSGQAAGGSGDRVLDPAQVGTDTDWAQLAAGEVHTCGLRTNGTLWCWGENGNGQLGQGNSTDEGNPVQVRDDEDWMAVTAGARHTCALKTDGTVWCFGRNDHGQLGTRNHSTYRRPRASCLPLP